MIEIEDTIVAIASPTSPAPRGIVRLSGDRVTEILSRAGIRCDGLRRATRFEAEVDLGSPLGCVDVDVLLWPTSRSYTGQPAAELHTIGSSPILTTLVDLMLDCGARAARPGEFTMRAFLAGRLDLTQAEAVLGVIEAEDRGSLDVALQQLAGNLSKPLEMLRSDVLDLLADVEAGLDFVDEDIEFVTDDQILDRLQNVANQIQQTRQRMDERGGGSRKPRVVLRGAPNAGKSSLVNRLAGDSVSIVTDQPGTTRDSVTADITLVAGSSPETIDITFVDTAGTEHARDEIEQHAQRFAKQAASDADVQIWCVDSHRSDFDDAINQVLEQSRLDATARAKQLFVLTKTDLNPDVAVPTDWIACSVATSDGVDRLRSAILDAVQQHDAEEVGSPIGTAARCRQSLNLAAEALARAMSVVQTQMGHEFIADELRQVAQAIGEVTGTVYTDDILDRVFGRFCIGK